MDPNILQNCVSCGKCDMAREKLIRQIKKRVKENMCVK